MDIKIDFNASEFKEKEGAYYSVPYQMNIANREKQKELDKTYYIKDVAIRIKQMQQLIGDNPNDVSTIVTRGEIIDHKKLGFNSYEQLLEKQKNGMFYGIWVEIGTLRRLELEYFLQQIYDYAIKIKTSKTDKEATYEAVCYLIDQRYEKHTGVFSDSRADLIFSDEYGQLIYDYIGKMIKQISNIDIETEKNLSSPIGKLQWLETKKDLSELVKALSLTALKGNAETDIIKAFESIFLHKSGNDLDLQTRHETNKSELQDMPPKQMFTYRLSGVIKDFVDKK